MSSAGNPISAAFSNAALVSLLHAQLQLTGHADKADRP